MIHLRTLRAASPSHLKGKRVLVRVDFNVPLRDGVITDDSRITAVLPTLRYLVEQGSKVIIMTHLGRPDGKVVSSLKLDPVAKHLSDVFDQEVIKAPNCVGSEVHDIVKRMKMGDVVLLENTRFFPEDEANDPFFSKELASLGDVFVNDAFGVAHRAHASTYGVAELLPSYAGLLLEHEVQALSHLLDDVVQKPFVMIFGGAKIKDKLGVIRHFLERADTILVGGGIANTFLAAQGFGVGASLYEPDMLNVARDTLLDAEKHHDRFGVPDDVVCADEISDDAETVTVPVSDVIGSMRILDIGRRTVRRYCDLIARAGTVVWNGPMGLFEMKPFADGSRLIAEAVSQSTAATYIGGGDTLKMLDAFEIPESNFTHVSTGGGAMLKFLEGEELPVLRVLAR